MDKKRKVIKAIPSSSCRATKDDYVAMNFGVEQ